VLLIGRGGIKLDSAPYSWVFRSSFYAGGYHICLKRSTPQKYRDRLVRWRFSRRRFGLGCSTGDVTLMADPALCDHLLTGRRRTLRLAPVHETATIPRWLLPMMPVGRRSLSRPAISIQRYSLGIGGSRHHAFCVGSGRCCLWWWAAIIAEREYSVRLPGGFAAAKTPSPYRIWRRKAFCSNFRIVFLPVRRCCTAGRCDRVDIA